MELEIWRVKFPPSPSLSLYRTLGLGLLSLPLASLFNSRLPNFPRLSGIRFWCCCGSSRRILSSVCVFFFLSFFYFTFASSYYLFDGLANILTLLLLNHFYLWNWSLLPLWRPPVSSLFAVYEFELLWLILQTNIHKVDVWFHPFLLNACWSFSWRDIHPQIETPIC